jgi:hypothetical protein
MDEMSVEFDVGKSQRFFGGAAAHLAGAVAFVCRAVVRFAQ